MLVAETMDDQLCADADHRFHVALERWERITTEAIGAAANYNARSRRDQLVS